MDNFTPTYRVYIRVNEENYITQIEGECSLSNLGGLDQPNVIKIDEGEGERFYHAQGRYLEKPIMDFETGCYNYKYVNNEVVEVSDEEKAEIVANRPTVLTDMDKLEAQVFYTAMETDTLLED